MASAAFGLSLPVLGSGLVAFAGGLLFFGELNGRQKLPAVIGVLIGIILTILG